MNDTTECQTGFTSSFNISTVVLADVNPSWLSANASISSAAQQVEFPSATSIDHAQVKRLARAVAAILIISVLISFSAIPLTIWKGPFNSYIFPFLAYDTLVLFAAVIIFYSIFRQEVAGAYSPDEIPRKPVLFGYGAWLLVAVFLCRLVTNLVYVLGRCIWSKCKPDKRTYARFVGYSTTPLP